MSFPHQEEFNFIKSQISTWNTITEDNVKFIKFPFGLSRAVYKVSLQNIETS